MWVALCYNRQSWLDLTWHLGHIFLGLRLIVTSTATIQLMRIYTSDRITT